MEVVMSELIQELQREYGYSDYDIAKVKYVLASLFSEFSKLLLFGTLFGVLGYFYPFLFSLFLFPYFLTNLPCLAMSPFQQTNGLGNSL